MEVSGRLPTLLGPGQGPELRWRSRVSVPEFARTGMGRRGPVQSCPQLILEARKAAQMSLPEKLQRVVDRFASAPRELKGQALLRYANQVPELPPRYADEPDLLARVHECQSPFFLATEVDDDGSVHFFFDCPPETPTVRGFAGIIREGLEGEHYTTVLEVPTTFYADMGLDEVVSPMRLRGMGAIMAAIRRGIRSQLNGEPGSETPP